MPHYKTTCCVFGCNSKKVKNPNLSFHKFPAVERDVTIVNKLGIVELTSQKEAWIKILKIGKYVNDNMRICSLHFTKDDYMNTGDGGLIRRLLKGNAVPSKNLPEDKLKQIIKDIESIHKKPIEIITIEESAQNRNANTVLKQTGGDKHCIVPDGSKSPKAESMEVDGASKNSEFNPSHLKDLINSTLTVVEMASNKLDEAESLARTDLLEMKPEKKYDKLNSKVFTQIKNLENTIDGTRKMVMNAYADTAQAFFKTTPQPSEDWFLNKEIKDLTEENAALKKIVRELRLKLALLEKDLNTPIVKPSSSVVPSIVYITDER